MLYSGSKQSYRPAKLNLACLAGIMDIKAISAKAQAVIEPVLLSLGYELVDCEFVNDHGWVLRVYIDNEAGSITIADCAEVSRSVSAALDVDDVIPQRYSLEVSSPGLNRPLRRLKDFERFKGEKARIRTIEPIDGRGNYIGILQGVAGDDILINVDGTEYKVPLNMVSKAKLEHEFKSKKE